MGIRDWVLSSRRAHCEVNKAIRTQLPTFADAPVEMDAPLWPGVAATSALWFFAGAQVETDNRGIQVRAGGVEFAGLLRPCRSTAS
jgi:hypothetical protein